MDCPEGAELRRTVSGYRRYQVKRLTQRKGCGYDEWCLCEALYPPPSTRPFFKGLLNWEEFFETQSPVTSY